MQPQKFTGTNILLTFRGLGYNDSSMLKPRLASKNVKTSYLIGSQYIRQLITNHVRKYNIANIDLA